MNIEDMDYNELRNMDYEDVKDFIYIDWEKHCYNPEDGDCSGSCQGATSCPLAIYYWSRAENDLHFVEPSKEDMIDYFKRNKWNNILLYKWNGWKQLKKKFSMGGIYQNDDF